MSDLGRIVSVMAAEIDDARRQRRPIINVPVGNLDAILRDWKRLDEQARIMYKPHHDLLAGKVKDAEKALQDLGVALDVLRAPNDYRIVEARTQRPETGHPMLCSCGRCL